jgi:hypothetical protein
LTPSLGNSDPDQLGQASIIQHHDKDFGNERYQLNILPPDIAFESTSTSSVPTAALAYGVTTAPRAELFLDYHYTYQQDKDLIGAAYLNADLCRSSTWFGSGEFYNQIPFDDRRVSINNLAVDNPTPETIFNYISPLQAQCEVSRSISNPVPATFICEDGFSAVVPAYEVSQTRFANPQIGNHTPNSPIVPSVLMDVSSTFGLVPGAKVDSGHRSSQIMKSTSGSVGTDSIRHVAGSSSSR